MDRVFCDVTGMENEAIFPGEGIEEIAEGSGEADGMSLKHGGSFPQSQEQYQTPSARVNIQLGKPQQWAGRIPRGSKNLTNAIQWLRHEHTLAEERYYMTPPNQRRGIQPPPFPHVPENTDI
ncbi:hypothetical protein RHSIM_Rhsim03G0199200 [Rhododendron simsii]|uniref:Uncharacterized protein n=1 Tax=Rhododendron simsii TaxID=118357 RepID=A0A834H9H0_RHOSS|nr:hypothetical protein RHSIM_Rhsim03G0199200 [Rhododendron simsii]